MRPHANDCRCWQCIDAENRVTPGGNGSAPAAPVSMAGGGGGTGARIMKRIWELTAGATMDKDPKDMTTTELFHEFLYVSHLRRTFNHADLPLASAGLTPELIAAIEAEINRRIPNQ